METMMSDLTELKEALLFLVLMWTHVTFKKKPAQLICCFQMNQDSTSFIRYIFAKWTIGLCTVKCFHSYEHCVG